MHLHASVPFLWWTCHSPQTRHPRVSLQQSELRRVLLSGFWSCSIMRLGVCRQLRDSWASLWCIYPPLSPLQWDALCVRLPATGQQLLVSWLLLSAGQCDLSASPQLTPQQNGICTQPLGFCALELPPHILPSQGSATSGLLPASQHDSVVLGPIHPFQKESSGRVCARHMAEGPPRGQGPSWAMAPEALPSPLPRQAAHWACIDLVLSPSA